MEPLLDKDAKGGSDKCDEETQDPKSVDGNIDCGLLERWRGEIRNGGVEKVSIDRDV